MKRVALLLLLLLLPGVQAYHESQLEVYDISWDGSANVTIITVIHGPESVLNRTRASVEQLGLENATGLIVGQVASRFSQYGFTLENATAEIDLDFNGSIRTVVRGVIRNFARYYSYDDTWEVYLDVFRTWELSSLRLTNETVLLENTFIVNLPEGAELVSLTEGQVDVQVQNGSVVIRSRVTLPNTTATGGPFVIQYRGRPGVENYTVWSMRIYNNLTIMSNQSVLEALEEYVSPEPYINYLRLSILYQGVQNAEQDLYSRYVQAFGARGVRVVGGSVEILNVNSTGPLAVRYRLVLLNLTRNVNGTYVYTYDPALEMGRITFTHRLMAQVEEYKRTRITLDGGTFLEVPEGFTRTLNGNLVRMEVVKLADNEVLIESEVLLRYGLTEEDYNRLMEGLEEVEFRFTLPEEKTCGPGMLVVLALLPLLRKKA